MAFQPQNFDQLIKSHGYNCYWAKAVVCQCIEHNQPQINCPYCKGKGWRYFDREKIRVVATSLSGDRDLKIQGLTESGTVYITPERDIVIGIQDRLEFYETTCKHSQTLKFNGRTTSKTFRPIRQISYVVQDKNLYIEGKDFVVKEHRYLEWVNNDNKPKKDVYLSILYLTTPEYIIAELVHELRAVRGDRGSREGYHVEMPKQYRAVRLEFDYGITANEKKDGMTDYLPEVEDGEEFYYGG